MVCSSCGADNRPGRKFCTSCGASLAHACPLCNAPLEGRERFCGECGTPITAPAGQPPASASERTPSDHAAERRLVSVLFADLVGFTALSEQRDPEEVRELLTRYFEVARDVIVRYGGVVEKFIGDAVMAVWGAPVAHEDDAERAVRAALELVDGVTGLGAEVGAHDLRLRAGVLTGEAAVTVGAEGQGMVAGDLVNTAARLQSAAAPGTVLVGERTHLAASAAISFHGAGLHTVKGKELAVQAWRAIGVVAGRGGFRRSAELEAPFVGRDEELRLLKDALHSTGRDRRPRLVSVVGVAGVGKTRLSWELEKYVDGLAGDIYWHRGRCPAYGEGVTFWALGEMVRMRARILENEDVAVSRSKLAAALDQYVVDAAERRRIGPRLAHLLGLDEAAGEREELFSAWRTFFERVSDHGPTVMLFEDLQWADPGLIDFIEHVLEWARGRPILIVTVARPELLDGRPTWGAGQRNFTSVQLEPLGDEDMRKLLSGVAQGLPDHLTDQIVERAEGIPLYGIEMIRMLIDRGHLVAEGGAYRLEELPERLEVPETLHSLIAARLDALSPDDRHLLQDASVLGKTFTPDALTANSEQRDDDLTERLRDLVRRDLLTLEVDPYSPERGQYGFVQGMIREVAYQTLSRRDRAARHARVASYFESLEDDELAGVVAMHYIEAHNAASGDDAETLAAKARTFLTRAADRAASLGGHRQAVAYLEQATYMTGDLAERAALWERAAEAALTAADHRAAESYLAQVLAWAEEQGDGDMIARAKARQGNVLVDRGRADAAIALLEEALGGRSDLGADPALVAVAERLARAHMIMGQHGPATEWADRTLAAAERLDLLPIITHALTTKAVAAHEAGRWREAAALLAGVMTLFEGPELPRQQARVLNNLSYVLITSNPQRALGAAKRGLELARQMGFRDDEIFLAGNACELAIPCGDWDWAHETLASLSDADLPESAEVVIVAAAAQLAGLRGRQAEAGEGLRRLRSIAESLASPQEKSLVMETEAEVSLAAGELETAFAKGMLAAAEDPSGSTALTSVATAGRAALWLREPQRVAAAVERLAETQAHGAWLDAVRMGLEAGLAALEGRTDEGATHFAEAAKALRDLDVPFDLALTQLDRITVLGADHPDSPAAAEEAHAIFERLGAKPFLERLEAALLVT
ncbi:adenylate/guanylate cyclase domain-containing protein [soil metagenome]